MNAIDIGIIAILLLGGLRGYRRGLLLMVVGLGSYLVGLLVATRYYGIAAAFLNEKLGLVDRVSQYLGVSEAIPTGATKMSVTVLPPAQMSTAVEALPIPAFAREEMVRSLSDLINLSFQQGITRLGEVIGLFFASMVVDALVFLLICIVVSKLVRIIAGLLTSLTSGLPLGGFNRATGFLAGIATTAFILVILTGVLVPFLMFAGGGETEMALAETLSRSAFIPYLMSGWHFLVRQLPLLLA
jgi:uncharacterized membrane protein required for colicin V production